MLMNFCHFQLKDFLTLYNKVTELCFGRCVDNLFDRELTHSEVGNYLHSIKIF